MKRRFLSTAALALTLAVILTTSTNGGTTADAAVDAAKKDIDVDLKAGGETIDRKGEESFEFQAEVNRLMDIIIHSLYSNRDIFLRELISNASDAIDKIRFLSLTNQKVLGEGDMSNLDIRIRANKEKKTLEIVDKGIGMTRDDLIKNLGTIAKSGTGSFLEKVGANKDAAQDSSLIGQFGVGFYSAYLVADRVTVTSKHNDDKQYVWESGADQTFTIYEDVDGEDLGRGTKLTLYLKDDASEYLSEYKLQELIKKYSQFISFPIYLRTSKEIEVPADEAEDEKSSDEETKEKEAKGSEDSDAKDSEATASTSGDEKESPEKDSDKESKEKAKSSADEDDIEVKDVSDESDESESPTSSPTPIKKTVFEWSLMNENKPIWTRDAAEITEDEYNAFYSGIAKMPGKPMAKTHFKAEGEVDFRSILYIPDKPPVGLYSGNTDVEKDAIKLFIRRVLVTDKFEFGLLPRYLGFLVGIVDSDDLPINVSREMLQKSKTLDVIKRKLIRKALEMIRSLMKTESSEEDEKEGDDKDDKDAEKVKPLHPYLKFWKDYGKSIKLGIVEDQANRQRLAKLLRFRTSKSNMDDHNDWSSLDDYMERMKEDQDNIYYHSGESVDAIKKSPFLEKLLKKGYEVIYLTEPIDEHMVTQLPDYEGSQFMSVAKDNFRFGDKDEKEEKEKATSLKKQYKPLTRFLKKKLGDKVSKVKLSTRLSDTPCVLSSEQWGYSARMEIIMKAQAFADPESFQYMAPKSKIMEINPGHPLIKKMLDLVKTVDKDDEESIEQRKATDLGHLVYDTALISSGYLMTDNTNYALRMNRWLAESVGVDPDARVEEVVPEAEEEETKDSGKPQEETEKSSDSGSADMEAPAAEEEGHDEL